MFRTLKNQEGFTLIELVIIIILIGVLAAIAIPRYVDLRDNAIRAAAQATLDAGRAAVSLDFADQVLNTGTYVDVLSGGTPGAKVAGAQLTALEAELQSTPNYPPGGAYDTPTDDGFRWWLVSAGSTTPAQPPVIDGAIDLTCAAGDAFTGANDDCMVSRL